MDDRKKPGATGAACGPYLFIGHQSTVNFARMADATIKAPLKRAECPEYLLHFPCHRKGRKGREARDYAQGTWDTLAPANLLCDLSPVQLSSQSSQPRGSLLGRNIPLRLGEHLISYQELAHGGRP